MVIINVIFTFLAALLPALVWLIFFSKEDIHPEPKRLIVYTFNVGVLISLLVLATQLLFQASLDATTQNVFVSILGLALIEEIFKFLAAYWAINNDPAFDEPIDAMIYMIAAALGFATVENFFIILNVTSDLSVLVSPLILRTLSLRFIGATLLHTLASGIVGYHWAHGHKRRSLGGPLALGLFIATLVHAGFNYLILKYQNVNLLYPSALLIIAAFFVLHDFDKLRKEEEKEEEETGAVTF